MGTLRREIIVILLAAALGAFLAFLAYRRRDLAAQDPLGDALAAAWLPAGVLLLGVTCVALRLGRELQGVVKGRKQLEDELERFFALGPDLFCIAGTDGYMKRVNPGFEASLGYSQEEFLSKPFIEFVHEEDRAATLAEVQALAEGRPTVRFSNRYRCRDGGYRWFEWNAMPGPESLVFAAARDVTERKVAEEELRRSDERLDLAIEVSTEGLWDWDLQSGEVYFSPRWFETLGFAAGDVEKTAAQWQKLIHPDDLPRVRETLRTHLAGDMEVYECESRQRMKSGAYRWTLDRGKVVSWNAKGEPLRMIGVAMDVTGRKEAQSRRLQSERLAAIGEAMTGLSHESRNALQRSQAYLERLCLKIEDEPQVLEAIPEVIEFLRETQEAQDELHRLYERVRDYAAPIPLKLERCCLREIIEAAWSHLAICRQGRAARLTLKGHAVDAACVVDRNSIEQVFRNVFENALLATTEAIEIVVRVKESRVEGQPGVEVLVSDNGPGMTEEVLHRLFEPFFSTRTKGTGLGMAIVQRLVESHGGSISAATPQRGAEIAFTLPKRT